MFDLSVWMGAALMGLSLGLLGSGGSILTVPILVYLAKEPEKLAIAESLFIVGIVALVGSVTHLLQRNIVIKHTFAFGIPSMFTAYLGAYLSQWVSGQLQLMIFAIVMLAASVFMLKPIASANLDSGNNKTSILTLALSGLMVGTLAGFVGVGGGFLIVPALLIFARIPIKQAVATSLVVIVMQCFSGFIQYANQFSEKSVSFNWELIGLVTSCAVAGVLVGIFTAQKVPQQTLKKVFGVLLIPTSVFILATNL